MSIVTEIQRVRQAKTDLKTAIENKGVTIDETATIDSYASKVDEIEVSSGDSHYDTFWDNYQQNGERKDYSYAFYREGWTIETFKPKYNMIIPYHNTKLYYALYMFYKSNIEGDLVEILEKQGVTLDLSKSRGSDEAFRYSKFTRLGVINLSKTSTRNNSRYVFANMTNLETIDEFTPPTIDTWSGNDSFSGCSALKNITIGGAIITNISFQSCPLTVESMKSVITHLYNYAGTTSEFSYTVKFSDECWELLDAEGETAPHGGTWKDYVGTLCWNI